MADESPKDPQEVAAEAEAQAKKERDQRNVESAKRFFGMLEAILGRGMHLLSLKDLTQKVVSALADNESQETINITLEGRQAQMFRVATDAVRSWAEFNDLGEQIDNADVVRILSMQYMAMDFERKFQRAIKVLDKAGIKQGYFAEDVSELFEIFRGALEDIFNMTQAANPDNPTAEPKKPFIN